MPKTFLFLFTILLGHTCVDAGFTRFSDQYEIYFSSVTKTWSQASSACESRGMHLIKVVSSSLTSIISTYSREYRFIGANDLASEGNWVWQDGTSAAKSSSYYNNWNSVEPNGEREENCAVADVNGGWVDIACERAFKYICQKTTYYTDLYELDFFDLRKTWASAKQFCERKEYRLVKIDSDSLTSFIESRSSEDRWIGASDIAREGQWKWSDGSIVNDTAGVYSNWKAGEPSRPNGATDEDCAFVQSNGKWDDAYCWNSKKFICQKDLPQSVSYNNHLYTFHRTERVDWDTAKNACASRGSRLVEIHNSATNNVIKNNIRNKNRGVQFFSGGNEAYYKIVTWDSGATASYNSGWSRGEPSRRDETKIALSMNGWNDVKASIKLPYICEMANVSAITLPNKPLVIGEGNVVKAICSADGVPWTKVSWNFSSIEVATNSSATIYQSKGNGKSVLKADNTLLTDEGTYKCIAKNQAGNFNFTISKEFNVTVPSVPEYVYAQVQECSPAINIRWKSNSRARNVRHKITVKNVKNASDAYEIPNLITDGAFTVNVKEWQTYNLTITPCPTDVCKGKYALSNLTSSPTVGRPGKAFNVSVNQSSKYSCSIKWQRPVDITSDYVTNYKVIVGENLAYPPSGSTERIREITVVKNQSAYAVKEKPNIRYNFGVQAQTCVGFGDIVWLNGSCVTDPNAPDNIEKPVASPNTGMDGTALVTINIPSQENGKISCLFVIVKVRNGSVLPNNYTSNYTRDDLIRANASTNTNEYIALALSYESVSKNNRVILGDERITECELSSTAKRRKRSDGNNVFVGRNLKLDASKNNSVLIVTSSPTRGDNLLKASESVRVVPATGSAKTSATTAVVGGVLGGLIAILLILIVVILLLKKRKEKSEKIADPLVNTQSENLADGGSQNGAFVEPQYANIEDNPYEMSTDVIYQNHEAIIPTKKRTNTDIPMQEFEKTYNSMHANQGVAFTEQFQELTKRAKYQALSTAFASQPELKSKNRYKNILPYDNTRVPITHNDNGYINACYIDGFEQKKKYIATQGPLSKTVNDFWLMIVEQKVTSIVMLAKCVEAGKKKCEKYWPDVGETGTFGLVTVSTINEVRSCGYVCRTIRVKAKLENEYESAVSQYHFLTWPDHGFPLTTSHILRMHQQVVMSQKNAGSTSPIVVHCSAGAGRTGTFIGYDYLLSERKSVGNADVFECVAKMRSQRVEMVQNCDQFILVHKLLLESHIFGNTDISRQEVLEKFSDSDYQKKMTADEFGNLSRVTPMDMTKKNTAKKICAYDRMKVKFFEDGDDIAKPLGASFVEAYNDSLKIMVSKEPTATTVELFWKVVCNLNITAVVSITEDEHDQMTYWDQGQEGGEFTVVKDSEQTTPNFTVRKYIVKGTETKSVTHLHLKLNSSEATRKTVTKMNECVSRLQKELREIHGAALIHCKSGKGMSGVFCAMMNILERLAVEDRVDVFRAVKDLRDCKKGMVETQAQYALCYNGVLEYLRNFDTYSNFM